MTWLWLVAVVAFLAVVFTLGMRASEAFSKPHAPDRRSGQDRRTGTDRRTGADRRVDSGSPHREIWTEEQRIAYRQAQGAPTQGSAVAGTSSGDRRVADRRLGDRRKKQPMRPRVLVVVSAVILLLVGVMAFTAGPLP